MVTALVHIIKVTHISYTELASSAIERPVISQRVCAVLVTFDPVTRANVVGVVDEIAPVVSLYDNPAHTELPTAS